ncbi:hypothetical protein [Cellulophaga sp. E6(2014)]|uniref:hypothetical protein n=1 Tax=Cellulophaga sp. E6(2014) TaxID=1495334 RepID=UPI00051CFD57|nr:hypothetical protein [Cellulophaga sp. E6(2014)]KGK28703.1 hypothetical protein EL45_19390 [Cellulophaga sp. E6(2014)]
MNKTILLLLLLTIGFISCKNSKKEIDRVEITKQYFKVLVNSDYSKISDWFADSLKTIEGEHKNTYSKSEYLEILKWDSVFEPNYEILEIEQKDGIVKAKISKMDKRIFFLHEKPFIMNQIISFQKNKIISVETDYLNFDYPTWEKNKNGLLSWIDKNHPELNGFINDLTEDGGMKFLKAIELYKNKK